MSIYFIDYENVGSAGLTGMSQKKISQNDIIIIFYSEKAKSITMDLHQELEKTNAIKEYVKVNTGTANALDFQLSSYLGYYVKENSDNHFFIISKDLGFENVCAFWEARNIYIKRINSISSIDENIDDIIKALSGILTEEESLKVYKIICTYKKKQDIHNNLIKHFAGEDNKKATKVYKTIKPFI